MTYDEIKDEARRTVLIDELKPNPYEKGTREHVAWEEGIDEGWYHCYADQAAGWLD